MPLAGSVGERVQERSGSRPQGHIRLAANLRYFGHCLDPVSFWDCYDPSGEEIVAVVAHVTNTPCGERHA
jgi:DUF1365 family protein